MSLEAATTLWSLISGADNFAEKAQGIEARDSGTNKTLFLINTPIKALAAGLVLHNWRVPQSPNQISVKCHLG